MGYVRGSDVLLVGAMITQQQTPATVVDGPGAWPTLTRSADVLNLIAKILDPLLRLLFPAPGRHRAPDRRRRHAQRSRRRALWLATHGIDTGARRIHGVEVA